MSAPRTADERFASLVQRFLGEPGVTPPEAEAGARRFGSDALKVDGRIFAMVTNGTLVVKLPARRVSELLEAGEGASFDGGKGRPMKEWLTVDPASDDERWRELANEALAFVRASGSTPRRPGGSDR